MKLTLIYISLLFMTTGFSFSQNSLIEIEPLTAKFGKVPEGEVVKMNYTINNKGNQPLVFNEYSVSCECTKLTLPQAPLLPGKQIELTVLFNTNGKIGFQKRTVVLKTNLGEFELGFKGVVQATEETKLNYRQSK